MLLYIFISTGDRKNQNLSHSTIIGLTEEEPRESKFKDEMEALNVSANICLGKAAIDENDEDEGVFIEDPMIYEDPSDPDPASAEPIEEEAIMPDVEDFEYADACYQYILASVILPKDYGFSRSLVTSWKRDLDGNNMESRHSNPLLDTCV